VAGTWLLEVESAGPCWLGADWLRSQGIDLPLDPERVGLYLGSQPVPYLMFPQKETPGMFFYAVENGTRFAPWSAYRLEIGQGAGQGMASAPLASSPLGPIQETFWTTLWQEQDVEYRPQIQAAEPWFWQPVFSGHSLTQTVVLTEALAGPITVTVRLWNRTTVSDTRPLAAIRWDGEPVGTWQTDKPAEQSWPATLDGEGGHQLVVDVPPSADGSVTKLWLDGFGVTYRTPFVVRSPGITWLAERDGAAVAGAEGARLLDVSDPAAPLDLGVIGAERVATRPGHHYWLGIPWLAPSPARSRPLTTLDKVALDGAQYVIVAPEPFWAALQPLVDHRQSQGLTVARLTPFQVYDAFGDGRPAPEAIRAMVNRLHEAGRLHYLLLVGDASARPDGYAGEKGALRVVTALVPIAQLYETPSDQALALDEAGQPLAAVGRFPAETAAQVQAMVAKTLQWEDIGLISTILLNDDEPDFGQFADDMSAYLPAPMQRLDASDENARAAVLAQLEKPGTWLNYVGHGSLTLWGDEELLRSQDQWPQPAVVTVWACLSAYFIHPSQDSMAETWLHAAQGGAVAFLGPTGETYLSQQHPLAQSFYQAIEAGQTLGDALRAAWQRAGEAQRDAVRSFLLLGDPALQLSGLP
jgi:hypothetical protein